MPADTAPNLWIEASHMQGKLSLLQGNFIESEIAGTKDSTMCYTLPNKVPSPGTSPLVHMGPNTKLKPEHCAQLTGVVSHILAHADATWAEIVIDGAGDLYREIRLPNPLQNEDGTTITLKVGDRVNLAVTLAASARPLNAPDRAIIEYLSSAPQTDFDAHSSLRLSNLDLVSRGAESSGLSAPKWTRTRGPHYKIIRIPNRGGKYARCLKPRLASEG
jgi:hypothetical protein